MITALVAIFFYQVVYGLDIKSLAKHAFYFRTMTVEKMGFIGILILGTDVILRIQVISGDTTVADHRIITYKTGSEAGKTGGLNATADIADNCNDVHAPQHNQTSCVNGYVAGYDITCHIGIAKVRYGSCPY